MIRIAAAADAEAVRKLVVAAYQIYIQRIGRPPGPMLDDYGRRIADGQVWVLDDAAGMAGIVVLEDGGDALLLDNVAVAPDRQGTGCGRALIGFAEAEARRRGYRILRLYTHVAMTENQALYARIGFAETGRVTEKGFDRVYMEKALA